MCPADLVQEGQGGGSQAPGCFEDKRNDSGRGGGGDNTCIMGPLGGFLGLRSARGGRRLLWEEGGCFMYLSAPGSTTATSIMSRPSGWVHVRSARISPPEAVFPTTVSMVHAYRAESVTGFLADHG